MIEEKKKTTEQAPESEAVASLDVVSVESQATDTEKQMEAEVLEQEEHMVDEVEQPVVQPEPVMTPQVVQTQTIVPQKDTLEKEIDDVLAEDLKDLYVAMTPSQQKVFKAKGEETVSKIRQLIHSAKFNAKKVFFLIRDWLKLIPGVNRYFLEQEAKIKTDKIHIITEEEKRRGNKDLL